MQKSYAQEIAWAHKYGPTFGNISANHQLIICPSFLALEQMQKILEPTAIKLGAQNCATHEHGAYTGEISAISLAQIGCTFCIIGHSERRIFFGETARQVAQKARLLMLERIIPVICIGENEEEKNKNKTNVVIERQLKPVLNELKKCGSQTILIAYEPVWAIGSEKMPDAQTIENVANFIRDLTQSQAINTDIRILYGGSVSVTNATTLKKITGIDGLLIGGASLDFQELKKIVL